MTLTTTAIKAHAFSLGFTKVGIVPAEVLTLEGGLLREWLARGYHGQMGYMARGADKRIDPFLILPSARSVIALALNYYQPAKHIESPEVAKISRYAWGDDYHDVIGTKLQALVDWMRSQDSSLEAKSYVDAGPMMDKAWAVRAGIGWLGKHSNVITRDHGSWIFLAEILLNLTLDYDEEVIPDFCGTCTRCLDACPPQAIVAPYVVDAQRCISYGTIELKSETLPEPINSKLENWVFGCDICQDVCPWNRFAQESTEPSFEPRDYNINPLLTELADLTPAEFTDRYRGSPIKRTKHQGLLRNVQAVLAKQQE